VLVSRVTPKHVCIEMTTLSLAWLNVSLMRACGTQWPARLVDTRDFLYVPGGLEPQVTEARLFCREPWLLRSAVPGICKKPGNRFDRSVKRSPKRWQELIRSYQQAPLPQPSWLQNRALTTTP
jgi:hypothetical protein